MPNLLEEHENTTRSLAARRIRLLLTFFTFSGFVGILIEQVFERLLSTVVGGTTPAAAVVLSVYFLGLGLGGCLSARILRRKVNPILAYGWAELAVVVSCTLVLSAFDALVPSFAGILMWAAGDAKRMLVGRVLVATVIVLPAAVAMGMSFPFLSDLASRIEAKRTYIGRLYASNLLGAAAAAAAAPYVIFPYIGLSGGLVVCIIVDGLVALGALRFSHAAGALTDLRTSEEDSAAEIEFRHLPVLLIAFMSGLVFFSLEVIWTHLVAVVINSSVYAFSSMLFFATLGLGLGAHAASRRPAAADNQTSLGVLFLISAALILFQSVLWPSVPGSLASLGLTLHTFYAAELLRWLHLALLLLPSTFIYGMIYPLLFRDSRFESRGVGSLVGLMTAMNAAGCVLGALLASFLLIPLAGSEASLRGLSVVLALCGIAALSAHQATKVLRIAIPSATLLLLLAAVIPRWDLLKLTSGLNIYFRFDNVGPLTKLIWFHEDSYGGVTTVVENPFGDRNERILLTNGKFQGNDGGQTEAQIGFAAIPTLHLARRERALMIGLGTGQSADVLSELNYQQVRIAELAPGVVEAARGYFPDVNYHVLDSGRATVYLEDGRNVLLSKSDKYSLITIEVTSVWFAGATSIYSQGFYKLAKARLMPGGVFQQWIQLHHIGSRELDSVLATVRSVFPHVSVWYFGGQGIIVATENLQALIPESESAVRTFLLRQLRGDATLVDVYMNRMLGARVLDDRGVDRLVSHGAVINTDWNRWLEYATPRYNNSEIDWAAVNLAHLGRYAK